MNGKEFFDNLSGEVKAKLVECKTEEEVMNVLRNENIELDADTLADVVGGAGLGFNLGGGLGGGLGGLGGGLGGLDGGLGGGSGFPLKRPDSDDNAKL